MSLANHLKCRHLRSDACKFWLDEDNNVVTFPLWNLSGQMVGYQQYRPNATKERRNDPKQGRYFTFYGKDKLMPVYGVETMDYDPRYVVLCEGIFDVCRLHNYGLPAVAVLNNDPKPMRQWLASLGRKVFVVADNDEAGRKLAKLGIKSWTLPNGDLGDAKEEQVRLLVTQILDSV